jgi:hypothetical protein
MTRMVSIELNELPPRIKDEVLRDLMKKEKESRSCMRPGFYTLSNA